MGFRDELGAAQARADALQRRVAELEAEKAAAEAGPEATPEPPAGPQDRFALQLGIATFGLAVLLGAGALVARAVGQPAIAVAAVASVGALFVAFVVLLQLVEIVPPGFVLVLSGRRHRGPDGREIGYRVVAAGRTLRVPMLEIVDRLDVRPRPIDVSVKRAYTKGGVPLDVGVTAVIHLARHQPQLDNAIERFLGRANAEVDRVARETLEGHLRGAFATLAPEVIRDDAEKLAHHLVAHAEDDFARLGIVLDSLHVVRVSGD